MLAPIECHPVAVAVKGQVRSRMANETARGGERSWRIAQLRRWVVGTACPLAFFESKERREAPSRSQGAKRRGDRCSVRRYVAHARVRAFGALRLCHSGLLSFGYG
jgi:hypothetical protein